MLIFCHARLKGKVHLDAYKAYDKNYVNGGPSRIDQLLIIYAEKKYNTRKTCKYI